MLNNYGSYVPRSPVNQEKEISDSKGVEEHRNKEEPNEMLGEQQGGNQISIKQVNQQQSVWEDRGSNKKMLYIEEEKL